MELSYRFGETIGIYGENVRVLKVNRSRSIAEKEQEEVDSLGVVVEVAGHGVSGTPPKISSYST